MAGVEGFDVVGYVVDIWDEKRRADVDGEDIRFVSHKPERSLWCVFLGLVVVGLCGSIVGDLWGVLLSVAAFAAAGYWLYWSWVHRDDVDGELFAACLFRDGVEGQFCAMENKLINLMCQSKGIPDRFRDGFVSVKCSELDERRVSFVVSVHDVVGAIEFIESNADKWAAAFGDRDGADVSVLSTGVYRLDFDLLGSRADDVVVEW